MLNETYETIIKKNIYFKDKFSIQEVVFKEGRKEGRVENQYLLYEKCQYTLK